MLLLFIVIVTTVVIDQAIVPFTVLLFLAVAPVIHLD